MSEPSETILSVSNLSYTYGKFPLWKGIDFSLPPGQLALLLGSNGAGKSTLLRCLAGWLTPCEGSIEFLGEQLTGNCRELRSQLAFVNDVPSFYEDLTAEEHLQFVLKANRAPQDRFEEGEQLLRDFELWSARDRFPSSYSRGMREKLALVIALSLKPKLLLLDEPFGPIDLITSEKLVGYLNGLLARGCSIILSCHQDIPGLVAHSVLEFKDEKLLCYNEPQDSTYWQTLTKAGAPSKQGVIQDEA